MNDQSSTPTSAEIAAALELTRRSRAQIEEIQTRLDESVGRPPRLRAEALHFAHNLLAIQGRPLLTSNAYEALVALPEEMRVQLGLGGGERHITYNEVVELTERLTNESGAAAVELTPEPD